MTGKNLSVSSNTSVQLRTWFLLWRLINRALSAGGPTHLLLCIIKWEVRPVAWWRLEKEQYTQALPRKSWILKVQQSPNWLASTTWCQWYCGLDISSPHKDVTSKTMYYIKIIWAPWNLPTTEKCQVAAGHGIWTCDISLWRIGYQKAKWELNTAPQRKCLQISTPSLSKYLFRTFRDLILNVQPTKIGYVKPNILLSDVVWHTADTTLQECVEDYVNFEHKKNSFGKAKCGFSNDTRGIVTGKYPQLASRIKALGDLYICLT